MNYYLTVLKKYAVFTGRARRAEYWYFILVSIIVGMLIGMVDGLINFAVGDFPIGVLGLVYSLAIVIPSLAVFVRRLHDTDHSGWWVLLTAIPIIGFIVLLVFTTKEGQPGPNQYGPNPKEEVVI